MSDIVERLRVASWGEGASWLKEAADEIERLRRADSEYESLCNDLKHAGAEIERLRAELRSIHQAT